MSQEQNYYQYKVKEACEIIRKNNYLTLSTSDTEGKPWVSPLYFAFDNDLNFYWLSSKTSRHSVNIHNRKDVAMVLFDSNAPKWEGVGLFFEAEAKKVTNLTTILKGLKLEYERLEEKLPNIKNFQSKRLYRVYQAKLKNAWITAEGESINGEVIDRRLPLNVKDIVEEFNAN